MKPHEWFVEHRADYAAGILEADDAAAFEAHLPGCGECREEIARVEADLAWLPMGVPPVPPRPGLRRRIVERALEGRRRRMPAWAAPAALAASLLLAIGVGWMAQGEREALRRELAIEQARTAALEDTLSVMRQAGKVLYADLEMGQTRGAIVIFADETTHRWSVVVHGLPPAPSGEQYQFWFITKDGMVRGHQVPASEDKPMMFTTGMPERGGTVMGAALTVEPAGSDDGPPRGKQLAHLML